MDRSCDLNAIWDCYCHKLNQKAYLVAGLLIVIPTVNVDYDEYRSLKIEYILQSLGT